LAVPRESLLGRLRLSLPRDALPRSDWLLLVRLLPPRRLLLAALVRVPRVSLAEEVSDFCLVRMAAPGRSGRRMPGRSAPARHGTRRSDAASGDAYLLLLREDRLLELELRLPDRLLPLALARSLRPLLLLLLLRLLRPLDAVPRLLLLREEDDPGLEEEEELRDAMACSLVELIQRPLAGASARRCGHLPNLGRWAPPPVGSASTST
jgi:hypothetical protein